MSYIDRLNAIKAQKYPERPLTQPTQRQETALVSVVSVPSVGAFTKPHEAFPAWRAHLLRLSEDVPLHGLERLRWWQVIDDARWLVDHFGQQAARDGWSVLDLFGVMPGRDAWGGVADRLRGSRSLVMSSDVARWRRVVNREPESFAQGLGETVPLWGTGQ